MVASDLSSISGRALKYAAGLAGHFNAHVYLTHVLTSDGPKNATGQNAPPGEKRESAQRKLSESLESTGLDDVRHTVLIEEGFLWQTLDTLIRKYKIDLVVVGTHGRRESREGFQGSWAELILRHADCPVITVGPACEQTASRESEIANILFATDFGRAAQHAIPYVCSLAREYRAALTLLHVVEDMGTSSQTEWASEWATLCETTKVRLLEYLPEGLAQQCTLNYLVQRGDSAREILGVARSQKADLIAMGAKLGSNLAMHLPEPTVYTVAAEGPCPVLTVGSY